MKFVRSVQITLTPIMQSTGTRVAFVIHIHSMWCDLVTFAAGSRNEVCNKHKFRLYNINPYSLVNRDEGWSWWSYSQTVTQLTSSYSFSQPSGSCSGSFRLFPTCLHIVHTSSPSKVLQDSFELFQSQTIPGLHSPPAHSCPGHTHCS